MRASKEKNTNEATKLLLSEEFLGKLKSNYDKLKVKNQKQCPAFGCPLYIELSKTYKECPTK